MIWCPCQCTREATKKKGQENYNERSGSDSHSSAFGKIGRHTNSAKRDRTNDESPETGQQAIRAKIPQRIRNNECPTEHNHDDG
jgi:hypothetical protein